MTELHDNLDKTLKMVWDDTPWMIDFHTDGINSERYDKIYTWLCDWYGRGRCPIGRNAGIWMMGSATVMGMTWIGFEREKDMETFLRVWG